MSVTVSPRVHLPGPITLLALLGVALATPVLMRPGLPADLAAVAAVVAAVAFAARAGGRSAWVAASAFIAYRLASASVPFLPASWEARLVMEALATLLPVTAFVALTLRARSLASRAPRTAMALLRFAVVVAAFGALVRLAAIYFLWPAQAADASTILYALRYDAAASAWAFAGVAVAAASVSLRLSASGARGVRAWRRHAAMGAVVIVVALIALDVGSLGLAAADSGKGMKVGYHSPDVDSVPDAADVVHVEAAWSKMGRADGSYHWDKVDAELEKAAARDLDVYLLVSAYPPQWFTDERPESIMVDRDGDPFYWIDTPPGEPKTRVWEVSFADPVARDAKRAFVEAAVERYADHPSVRIVAVLNEPAYPVDWNLLRWASFDPFTMQAFRHALHADFDGNLSRVNEVYGTDFASWDDVEPPAHPFGDYGNRWITFREDLLIDYVREMMDAARNHTDKPVTTKLMAHFFTRFAEPQAGLSDRVNREIADMSDVVSVDLYPVTKADLTRSLQYFRDIAGDKPLWVAEFNLAFGLRVPGAGLRLLGALEIMDAYADGVILFTTHGHFLYEASENTPGLAAVRVHAARSKATGDMLPAMADLLHHELKNVVALPGRTMAAVGMAGTFLVGVLTREPEAARGKERTRPQRRR